MDNKENRRAYFKAYREANREKEIARHKTYREVIKARKMKEGFNGCME